MNEVLTVIQITDTHLFANKRMQLMGINTTDSFNAVMDTVKQYLKQDKPDLICLTGDLAHDCTYDAYHYLSDHIIQLNCNIGFIPGNHDDAQMMTSVFTHHLFHTNRFIEFMHWHVILINTQVCDQVQGNVANQQLVSLENYLDKQRDKNIIIFTHHPAIPVNCQWLDKQKIENRHFLELISNYPNVRIVASGHVHHASCHQHQHLHMLTTPSTCVQFKPNSEYFAIEQMPPGFRLFKLMPNGEFTTQVIRAQNYTARADEAIWGYE